MENKNYDMVIIKIIISIGVVLAIIIGFLLFTNIPECIETNTSNVQVQIIDKYYQPESTAPLIIGKRVIHAHYHYPAKYIIVVRYNDKKYQIDNEELYYKYRDMIGEYITCTLETKYYNDGTVKETIIDLER